MTRDEAKELFLEGLKQLVTDEKSMIRFPFNVSKLNDSMRSINNEFHIQLTPYGRFGALLEEMENDGHCKSARRKHTVELVDSKYAVEIMHVPLTDEEKETLQKQREEKRLQREARKAAAAAENAGENGGANDGTDNESTGDKAAASEESEPAKEEAGEKTEDDDKEENAKSRSPSRSASRSRSRSRSRSGSNA